jgi:predicted lipoprotein with Yx(FWY)xxD motif
MSRSAPVALSLLAALGVGLAACGGDDDDGGDAAPAASGATFSVSDVGDAGQVVVDEAGAAVYASDEESGGQVLCVKECESIWRPVTVDGGEQPSGDEVPGELGTVERPDGAAQVTLDGEPLYTFTQEGPGEVTGDGLSDSFGSQDFTWHVISAGDAGESDSGSAPSGGYGGY